MLRKIAIRSLSASGRRVAPVAVAVAAMAIVGGGALALACAETAVTTWGYSSWFREGPVGEMGEFDRQREHCLQEARITDPASVTSGSPEENRFIRCMNDAQWCTTAYHCDRPGA